MSLLPAAVLLLLHLLHDLLCSSGRYRLPLDSEALVELWPTACSSPECLDYISQLEDFALDLQLAGCPDY